MLLYVFFWAEYVATFLSKFDVLNQTSQSERVENENKCLYMSE